MLAIAITVFVLLFIIWIIAIIRKTAKMEKERTEWLDGINKKYDSGKKEEK